MESITTQNDKYLLDTHTLLWWLVNDSRLSNKAFEIIKKPDNVILVSSASAWEISTKYRLGKLPNASKAATDLPKLLTKSRMEVLPISIEHAMLAGSLPGPHRDPFDRMLIAQGQVENLPIITADPAFKQYQVRLIW